MKRFFDTLRFIGGFVAQLLIPILFVLFGLILAVALPDTSADDPKRTLNLRNSAVSNKRIFFYATEEGFIDQDDVTVRSLLYSEMGISKTSIFAQVNLEVVHSTYSSYADRSYGYTNLNCRC